MSIVYLLQNQDQLFFNKSGEWVVPDNTKILYRTPLKDEVLNQKVELSVKNPSLRIDVIEATFTENGQLVTVADEGEQVDSDKSDGSLGEQQNANEDLFVSGSTDTEPHKDELAADTI